MNRIFSAEELEQKLGENVKSLRLQHNIDRQSLCAQAGVSENALRNLENGNGCTVKTLIKIVKALNRDAWLLQLTPTTSINPLHMVRNKNQRQRARRKNHGKEKNS